MKSETREPGAVGRSTYAIFIRPGSFLALTRASLDLNTVFPAPDDRPTLCPGINGTLHFSRVLLPTLGGVFVDALGFSITFLIAANSVVLAFALLGEPSQPIPAPPE